MKKAIFAGLLLATAAAAIAQVDPARVVATVNGVDIKGEEYYHRMEYLPGVGRIMGESFAQFPPGFLTLEHLITEKLIFQLAKNKGVYPTEPEVQAEFDYRNKLNPKLLSEWLAAGRSEQDLRHDIRFDLAQFKLLTAGITVTDQEVEQFYRANSAMYTIPTQVTLRVIVVRTGAEAAAVDKEMAAGKSFAEAAKAHSVDLTSKVGGEYGTVPITALSDNVRLALKSLPVGKSTEWFTASQAPGSKEEPARFKFLLEKVIAEKVQPLDADIRRQTRQRMMMDRGKQKNNLRQDLTALRSKSTIDIKDKGFKDAYQKFIDAYMKSGG